MALRGCGPRPRKSCGCGRSPIDIPTAPRGAFHSYQEADTMKFNSPALAAVLCAVGLSGAGPAAFAQAKEQFIPVLSYRTGAYAPNGVPFANGYVDYLKYVNAKGGLNGVKIIYEECDTSYATDK